MRIRHAIFVFAALSAACQGGSDAPAPVPERSDKLVRAAEPIPGQYLAMLADGIDEAGARALVARHGGTVLGYAPPPVNAVMARLAPERAIAFAEDAAVRLAEEDARVHAASASWNLDRIDQRVPPPDGGFRAATTGAGVHLYVVDTSVMLTHPELGGRADAPASFVAGDEVGACSAHGTHIAAVAAGATVGVAPGATVHAVRALDCEGLGAVSSLVLALDWIREHHETPAVAIVGAATTLSPTLSDAIAALVEAGVTVVAPAGNDDVDACSRLPAAFAGVLTVGATTAQDAVLVPSSQGACVDLFAPGAEIRSAAVDGQFTFATGTSQAAAHVAGAAALFLQARPTAEPAVVANALLGNATIDRLTGVNAGTSNRLLYVGFMTSEIADTTAPTVDITSPGSGEHVSGDVPILLSSASADVSQIAVFVDGVYLGADASPADGFQVPWRTERFGNGAHEIVARAFDPAGNVGEDSVTVDVGNPGNADYDPGLLAPSCPDFGQRCASGALLEGRGPAGPELNAPNTIGAMCGDGLAGAYRHDESIESIEVQAALPGRELAEGEWVTVDVTVWAYPDHATDHVDLHFASDAGAPAWQYLGTQDIPGAGLQTVRFNYRLPASPETHARPQQAVRATIRYGGDAGECTSGPYDDHDDLAFAVSAGAPDVLKPEAAIVRPASGEVVSGPVAVEVSAKDSAGGKITRVELYADQEPIATSYAGSSDTYTLTWNADAAALGDHQLQAIAYDASGNRGDSAIVKVSVADLSAPQIAIDLPVEDAVVGGIVHVEAIATDNRTVTAVEFLADGVEIGTATSPPWAVDWDSGAKSGRVELVAVARDGKHTTRSAPVQVVLDNAAPTKVVITNPGEGASIQGRDVRVEVEAVDDRGVVRVDVYAGGAYVDSASWDDGLGRWIVSWNSSRRDNGPAEIYARAFDVAGNSATSPSVVVQVEDNTAPQVAFTNPAAGAVVRDAVPIAVSAKDNGVLSAVEFLVGETSLGEDADAPYDVLWDTAAFPDGVLKLTARARDRVGLIGEATTTVIVDNHGPVVAITNPSEPQIAGVVEVRARAFDPNGVDHVDFWVEDVFLGKGTPVGGEPDVYAVTWATTEFDNRSFEIIAVAFDAVGNVSTTPATAVAVSNITTAELDPALGVPACASSGAWCFSGTLLDGAGATEANPPSTLDRACQDGASSVYHSTESVDVITVAAKQGALASGGDVEIRIAYWAYAGNEADQIDLYHAADARNPTWAYVGTVTPVASGAGEARLDFTLPSGPLQALRANYRFAQPGPAECSGGDFGDRDDLVFAVDSPVDVVAPTVVLEAPAENGVVSGDVLIRATVTDDHGVARVEFWIDDEWYASGALPVSGRRYEEIWRSSLASEGTHVVQVKAYDTSGNESTSARVAFTVLNVANAAFDASFGVPACSAVQSFCDPGTLLDGRGAVGPEQNAPNTIGATCLDGEDGLYHHDESLDWLKVSSVDGLPLEAGKRARVEARVWAYSGWSDDALDLYYTTTPDDPHWVRFATLKPAGPGEQMLTAEYVLPPSGWQAVRGSYRYGGAAAPCPDGPYDDRDDLVFAVEYTPNASYDPAIGAPVCTGTGASCDSGALVVGRGPLGPEPNAPNTVANSCADGTSGAYEVDPSVESILLRTEHLGLLKAATTARIEVRIVASTSWESERLDLFVSDDPNAASPRWTFAGTLRPTREGRQVLVGTLPLGPSAQQAVRAHLGRRSVWQPVPEVCGTTTTTSAVDDQDDLVFNVAP